jgi:hypothetical protein
LEEPSSIIDFKANRGECKADERRRPRDRHRTVSEEMVGSFTLELGLHGRRGMPTSLLVSGVGVDVPQLVVDPGELQLVVTAANEGQEY